MKKPNFLAEIESKWETLMGNLQNKSSQQRNQKPLIVERESQAFTSQVVMIVIIIYDETKTLMSFPAELT